MWIILGLRRLGSGFRKGDALGNVLGVPLGILDAILGFPSGSPLGILVGIPLGAFRSGIPLGTLVGNPLGGFCHGFALGNLLGLVLGNHTSGEILVLDTTCFLDTCFIETLNDTCFLAREGFREVFYFYVLREDASASPEALFFLPLVCLGRPRFF